MHKRQTSKNSTFGIPTELFSIWILFVDGKIFCDIITTGLILRHHFCIGDNSMFEKEVTVQNQVGLSARPATFFIQKANCFKSSIWIEKEERRVNAKSLLGVLSLGIDGGTGIKVIAAGPDEEQAVDELVKLVNSGFTM